MGHPPYSSSALGGRIVVVFTFHCSLFRCRDSLWASATHRTPWLTPPLAARTRQVCIQACAPSYLPLPGPAGVAMLLFARMLC